MFERNRNSRTSVVMAGALAVGALFGGSVVSVASPQAEVVYNRSVSCPGLNFYPASNTATWNENGVLRTGHGAMRCNASLPQGAVVKSVQFTVLDNDGSGNLGWCGLVRMNLVASAAAPNGYSFMALPWGEGGTSDDPNPQRATDSTVDFATVNNAKYAYYLQCDITDQSSDLGIYGANVNFTITASKG